MYNRAKFIVNYRLIFQAYVTNNGTTIPSPVDIDAWRNSASGYQLNGCVRVSRVYADSVVKALNGSVIHDDGRIPPDGQESAALLKHAENNCNIPGCGLNNASINVNGNNGTLKLS